MGYTFFGVQVAVTAFHGSDFRRRLRDAIAGAPARQTLREKRAFWKTIAALLNEKMPVFERGFWDLVRGRKAEDEFETWTSEIEGSLATEPAEMGSAAGEAARLEPSKRYVLVTCLILVGADTNSDQTLGARCDLPESQYWTRQTFARLVATFPLLNFAQVKADAVYLVPGNDRDALSASDLDGEGYEYLRALD